MPNTILLYRNTFFHDHCQHCTLKNHRISCPLPSVHSTETHVCIPDSYYSVQKHNFMWPLHTALYRYTLTCKLTSCTLEKHTFTCCLQSSTLQTRTVTFLLPPLHSTETHIHMPNTILLYRNTFFHDHCQHCTLKNHRISCPLPSVHSTETHVCIPITYCTLQKYTFTGPLSEYILQKHTITCHLLFCIREKHTFSCPFQHFILETHIFITYAILHSTEKIFPGSLFSFILQKHSFPCSLPSVYSRETHVHTSTAITELYRSKH